MKNLKQSELTEMNRFEAARQKYKPERIKYLFVAETPPKSTSDRFFYFENVSTQDSLFLETMKCLYPNQTGEMGITTIRTNKGLFLDRFKNDGFYLIDSIDEPFEARYSSSQKVRLIQSAQSLLLDKIRKLCDKNTKVILIAATVFKANYDFLISHQINVINRESIDFPGSGGQKKFRVKLKQIL